MSTYKGHFFSALSATCQCPLLLCSTFSPGNNEHEAIRQQSWFGSLKFVPKRHILVTLDHGDWEQKVLDFVFFEPLCAPHSPTPKP